MILARTNVCWVRRQESNGRSVDAGRFCIEEATPCQRFWWTPSVSLLETLLWTGCAWLVLPLVTKQKRRSAWVSQSVKCLPLDFSSGHELKVMSSGPASTGGGACWRCSLSASLCPFPSALHARSLAVSQKNNLQSLKHPINWFLLSVWTAEQRHNNSTTLPFTEDALCLQTPTQPFLAVHACDHTPRTSPSSLSWGT